MENQTQANSAAEKKKRVETIVATKGSSVRNDISEKAVASSTTSNGTSGPHRSEHPSWDQQSSFSSSSSFFLFFLKFLDVILPKTVYKKVTS